MIWPCGSGTSGSFAGNAAESATAFFTGDDTSQGSELGFWLWVSSAWSGPAVSLASFQPGVSTEPAWHLYLGPEPSLHLAYAETFPGTWSFSELLGFPPTDCWCWVSLSASFGALAWSLWTNDGMVVTGHAAMPGPSAGYAVTASGTLALGTDVSGLGGATDLGLDGGVKLAKLLYIELALFLNQNDPDSGASLVQGLAGEGSRLFLLPRMTDWPVMVSARAGNWSGAAGVFSGGFAAAGQGYNFVTTSPNNGLVFTDGPQAAWVRLSHSSGQGYWQSRGDVTEEWAGGIKRVLLPFPVLSVPPETYLGQDPATGLPAFCPGYVPVAPVPVPPITPPVTPPAPGDDCVQTRCGAAVALQTKLVDDYNIWRQWINAAVSVALGGVFAAFFAELAAILTAAEAAAWVLQVLGIISPFMSTAGVTALPSLLPTLPAPEVDAILEAFFCALQCNGGVVSFGAAEQQAVTASILGNLGTFSIDLRRELLAELVHYEPLQDWQAAMTNAAASDLCDGMTCP